MEEHPGFDRCFEAFWNFRPMTDRDSRGSWRAVQPPGSEEEPPTGAWKGRSRKQTQIALEDWDEGSAGGRAARGAGAEANRELLMEHDFSPSLSSRLDEWRGSRADRQASGAPGEPPSKPIPAGRGGGSPAEHAGQLTRGRDHRAGRRSRRRRKVRLVLLCDVSGSMDLYSRFLLQFPLRPPERLRARGDLHLRSG